MSRFPTDLPAASSTGQVLVLGDDGTKPVNVTTQPLGRVLAGSTDYIATATALNAGNVTAEGTLSWNPDEHTLNVQSEIADCVIQVGRELWIRVYNTSGATIPNGTAVMDDGAYNDRRLVIPALAIAANRGKTVGIATADIADGAQGYVTIFGNVGGIDTTAWTLGAHLYVSDTVPGALIETAPASAGSIQIQVAVNTTHRTDGIISVEVEDAQLSAFGASLTVAADAAAARALLGPFTDRTGRYYVSEFGAVGDGTNDDATAIQAAINAAHASGGGTIVLMPGAEHKIGTIAAGALPSLAGQAYSADSKALILASNIVIEGNGASLNFIGGSSAPFGWSFDMTMLAFSGTASPIVAVTSVTPSSRSIVCASIPSVVAGGVIWLSRDRSKSVSKELAPGQCFTVASITGSTITTKEAWQHKFEDVQDLTVTTAAYSFPENISFRDVTLSGNGYTLFATSRNVHMDEVRLDAHKLSFSSSQGFSAGRIIGKNNATFGAEGSSNITIAHLELDGDSGSTELGGVFINDCTTGVSIDHLILRGFEYTGAMVTIGCAVSIGRADIYNCGITAYDADAYNFPAAISLGLPGSGSVAGQSAFNSNGQFTVRNVHRCSIDIGTLRVIGPTVVPLRGTDVDLRIDSAYLEYAGTYPSCPVVLGYSGKATADAIFTAGGTTTVDIGRLETKSLNGTIVPPRFNGQLDMFMCGGDTTVASETLVTDTTVTVTDGSVFLGGFSQPFFFSDPSGDGATAIARGIVSVSGNVVTLSSAVDRVIPIGARVWSISNRNAISGACNVRSFTEDGNDSTGSRFGESTYYPSLDTGSGPYTGGKSLTVPGEGIWELRLSALDNASGGYAHQRFRVISKGSLESCTSMESESAGTTPSITGATISAGVVTVDLSASYVGQSFRLVVNWERIGRIAGLTE